MAVGAALTGTRPVVELMYADFLTLAMEPLVNQAAKLRYMFGGQGSVPMVLRTNLGASGGKAAQHSQCLESWVVHVPGLRVAVPATAADAYSLLKAAIRGDVSGETALARRDDGGDGVLGKRRWLMRGSE